MSDVWKRCEGQVVDKNFPLQQFLAGTEHSAVFLTQRAAPQLEKAAIKLIPADPATADLQLSLWARAAQFVHPNFLRLFHFGRCRLADKDLLYAVMEYAEEDLSQILPQRPLAASEAREMLEPLLDALVYLHGKRLVHSHIKPSNVLAAADQLKLSCDTVSPIGESRHSQREPDVYDAPESATSPLATSGDVWSLGVTLVEALTQHTPVSPLDNQSNPIFPDTLPQPFLDFTRHSLRVDPKRRWTVAEIAARLNPIAVGAAAGQSISPLAVPLSSVPAVPAAKLPAPRIVAPTPKAQPPRQQLAGGPKQTLVLPNYVVPVAGALFVLVAIIAIPKILSHRAESSFSASGASAQPASQPKPAQPPAHRDTPPPSKLAAPNSVKTAAEKKPAETPARHPAAAPVPAPAALRTDTFPSANAPKTSAVSPAHGEVLDQVLPDVSEKARGTISGKVRVSVRVHVDPTGNVSQAELDSPGPSKYFADQTLKAARRWEFTPPEINGRSVPSDWLIRFEFSQSGTKAFPRQVTP